jgi:hypothetical protein
VQGARCIGARDGLFQWWWCTACPGCSGCASPPALARAVRALPPPPPNLTLPPPRATRTAPQALVSEAGDDMTPLQEQLKDLATKISK